MNDRVLMVSKLENLLELTLTVKNDFERAALYGTLYALIKEFEEEDTEYSLGMGENIERARWHIAAILGYDITNEHDDKMHYSWALGAIMDIRESFTKKG